MKFKLSPLMLVALTLLVVILGWLGMSVSSRWDDPTFFPPDDYVEYWAASTLNVNDQNPYSGTNLSELQKPIREDVPVMMWNPPYTLTFALPLGYCHWRVGQALWLAGSLFSLLFSANRLWTIYKGPSEYRWLVFVLALTFLPTLFLFKAGQIGALLLLGATLFLSEQQKGRPYLAGAACVLLAIKPHLCFLLWLALAIRVIYRSEQKIILGGVVFGVVCSMIPILFHSNVFQEFFTEITQRPPEEWVSPTIGTMLRLVFGEGIFRMQFVPVLLGITWFGWWMWKYRNVTWDWSTRLIPILLISFITSPYGSWPFDVVLLLPAAIAIACQVLKEGVGRQKQALAFWVAYNTIALVQNLMEFKSFWFFWLAPVLACGYWYFRATQTPENSPRTRPLTRPLERTSYNQTSPS